MSGSHYDVLGVARDAAAPVVRKAYIALARCHHPDLNQGPQRAASEAAMQEVNEAWHVLSDEDRRRDYDTSLMFEESARKREAQARAAGAQHASADPAWEPFEAGDDAEREFDPRPIKGSNDVPRWVTLAPAVVFVVSLLVLGFGLLVSSRDILALGGVMLVFSVAGFILMPLIVMSRAERDPNL